MKAANRKGSGTITKGASPRASVTFPLEIYRKLGKVAKEKKVSLAWVVRDAAERYVTEHGAVGSSRKAARR